MNRILPLLMSTVILSACSMGLETKTAIEDVDTQEDEPSSEPASPWDSNDTNTDTNDTGINDTNVDTGTDSGTDTGTSGTLIPNLISNVTPGYGTTAGGNLIILSGGPFHPSSTVTIGGYSATVQQNTSNQLNIITPASPVAVSAEIRVDMPTGYGISDNDYIYFEDGLGLTGAIGSLVMNEYVGDYWVDANNNPLPSGTKEGTAWTAFVAPLDFHWWQYNTPILDGCARNGIDADGNGSYDDINGDGVVNGSDYYVYSGNLSVLDFAADSLQLQGTSTLTLNRSGTDPTSISYYLYEVDPVSSSQMPDNAFFDLYVINGPLAGMSSAQYARSSKQISLISPNLNTLGNINRSQTFSWTPTGADWMQIRMYSRNSNGFIHSDVICNVQDDGDFSFQNIHHQWVTGDAVYVQFSRIYESDITLPHNDSISRVIGIYTLLGAGIMN